MDSRDWEEEDGGEEYALRAAESSDEGASDEEELMLVDTALDSRLPMLVLPLYSLLSPEQQAKVRDWKRCLSEVCWCMGRRCVTVTGMGVEW